MTHEEKDKSALDRAIQAANPRGFFQIRTALLLWLATGSAGVGVVSFAFTGFVQEHRCRIPQCEGGDGSFDQNGSLPDYALAGFGSGSEAREAGRRCRRPEAAPAVNNSSAAALTSGWSGYRSDATSCAAYLQSVPSPAPLEACPSQDLVLDTSVVRTSLVTEHDFTCRRAFLADVFNTLYMVGMLIGSPLLGLCSDWLGRVRTLALAALMLAGAGTAAAFINSTPVFALLRILAGMGGMGCFMISYVLILESTVPASAVLFGMITGAGFTLGELVFTLEAYFFRDWFTLQLVSHVPILLGAFLYFLLPEPARWLHSKGRDEEARRTLEKMALVNGRQIPEHLLSFLSSVNQADPRDNQGDPRVSSRVDRQSLGSAGRVAPTVSLGIDQQTGVPKGQQVTQPAAPASSAPARVSHSPLDLFRPRPLLWRSLAMFTQWFSTTVAYYGLLFGTLGLSSAAGDPYLNFALNALMELPSVAVILLGLDRLGRRGLLVSTQVIAGLCCVAAGALTLWPEHGKIQLLLTLFGKMGATASFGVVYLYTTELYPTCLRATAVGACSMVARVGGVLSMLMPGLSAVWPPLPLFLMGGTAVAAAVVARLGLPETTGVGLPTTMEEAVNIGKGKEKKKEKSGKVQVATF